MIAAKDSHLIKGALTDETGNFSIPSVSEGNYRILASSVGFEKNYSDVFTLKPDSKAATVDFKLKPGLNMGASKTFWDKRGRLSLNFNDILYSEKTNAVIDLEGIKVDFFQREYSRNAGLTFSYQFGNTKVKNVRSRGTGSESETSRVKVE